MLFTPAETILQEEFLKVLETLKVYLDNLLTQLPLVDSSISHYASFLLFSLDPNILDHTGCEVATSWKASLAGRNVLQEMESSQFWREVKPSVLFIHCCSCIILSQVRKWATPGNGPLALKTMDSVHMMLWVVR